MQWCQLKEELGIFPSGNHQIKGKMQWCQIKEELGIFPRGRGITLPRRGLEDLEIMFGGIALTHGGITLNLGIVFGGIALSHGGITLNINGQLKEELGIFPSGNHQIKGQMQWCQLKEELGIFPQGRYQTKWKMQWCQ